MDYIHQPVLLQEVVVALQPHDGGCYVDGTVGGGGHAAALLTASAPTGRLKGCDRDGAALEAAGRRLAEFAGRFELRRGNFAELSEWVEADSADGVLLDLGVSSPQLDQAERGFSFQHDGPLDMRQDQRQALTAAELLRTAEVEELRRIFWEYGEERQAGRLARAIGRQRLVQDLATTRQLAELVERVCPRRGAPTHPATRLFQALRIAVNDELGSLARGLEACVRILKPGGRLAVITFHSLEARAVKVFGQERTRGYTFEGERDVPELRQPCPAQLRWVRRQAVQPDEAEVAANPRSRSAQLRVLEKTA